MSLSIIMPNYNSEKFIRAKINKLSKFLKKKNIRFEIIIIDDCSLDNSYDKIKKLKNQNNKIKLFKNFKNSGKSYSIIKGIKKACYKKIILIDSDLPYFYRLNKIIDSLKKFDLVIIDRRHKKSKNLDNTFSIYQMIRIRIGLILNKIIRFFLSMDYKDTQAGLKSFIKPKNLFKKNFVSKRFFFDLELILFFIKEQKKIKTIPVNFRVSNNSTIKIFDLTRNIEIIKELIKVVLYHEKINN